MFKQFKSYLEGVEFNDHRCRPCVKPGKVQYWDLRAGAQPRLDRSLHEADLSFMLLDQSKEEGKTTISTGQQITTK